MIAVKMQVMIPPSRRIEVELPADTPEGMAEVLVLVPTSTQERPTMSVLVFPDIDEEAWDEADKAIAEARRTDRLRHDDPT